MKRSEDREAKTTKVDEIDLRESVRWWLTDPSGLGCGVTPSVPAAIPDPRPDLVGIRHAGGDLLGDFELVTVLVRPSTKRFVSLAGQTCAQRLQADRVYLACYTANERFSENQIDVALRLGIGLVRIDTNLNCYRDLPAPEAAPILKNRQELLMQLGLVICQLCGVAFSCASDDDAGYVFWNELWADHYGRLRNENVYDRRYICPDCVRNLNRVVSVDTDS